MTDRLRIVHATRSGAFAGVEQFVLRLATRQALDGHEVRVIGGAAQRMERTLAAHGIAFTPAARTITTCRAIREAHDADVVNTHMTAADVAAVAALAGYRRPPAIVSTRHFVGVRGRGTRIPFDRVIGDRIDAEIAISHAVAASLGRPSTVVHAGVQDDGNAPLPRARTVLMVQRLEAEKRTDLGLRAFAASHLQDRGWMLEIAGDGAERVALQSLAAELGVTVRFLGFRDDVPLLMRSAGMLLAPCTAEGLGLAVLEAMSMGTPVIAADAGGHHEILEGLDPRALYSPEDTDAAARNLRELADDDGGRAALGSAGQSRQRAEFSLAAQAARTDAVYRAAIAGRMRRARG
ncbi:glycosyltransferase family 4 protein [Microbacterium atlanticum]|uniref:glycosyltransferase family 4 protein n=1 Tax=Microbacterium atlanticum TaxID=2782168 RepID=UPI001887392E|nr:glycosyltransferase family 4 protein [Microbacterium atlanticum]